MGKRDRTASATPIPQKPAPQNTRDITHPTDGKAYTAVTEGLATVLFPKAVTKKDKAGNEAKVQGEVFYNPIQQFNRDLSVLAIKAFGETFLEEQRKKREEKMRNRAKLKGKGEGEGEGEGEWRGKGKPDSDNKSTTEAPEEAKIETPIEVEDPTISSLENETSNKEIADPDTGPMDISTTDAAPSAATPSHRSTPPKFAILDALSATGLRALRYALEIPSATSITANDLEPSAVASIRHNITFNTTTTSSSSDAMSKIKVTLGNATHHMYSRLNTPDPTLPPHLKFAVGKYEVIDLDPFGTASPFLDAAVQAVSDGGMLAVTCTDAGVWASTAYSEKCFALYGGIPVKGEWCHEAGVRLILNSIAMCAARYGSWMEPLLSLSIDFYARVFVRIRRGPERVKRLASDSMMVYNCDEGCGSWVLQRLGRCKEEPNKKGNGTFSKFGLSRAPTTDANCRECGFPMHLAGPMYAGPIHSVPFLTKLINSLPPPSSQTYGTLPRITGMLQTALQESTPALSSTPFFFVTARLSKTLHCESPPLAAFRGALKGLGYEVARSHCKPTSIKTDAPWEVVWEVMRRWVQRKPTKEGVLGPKQAGYRVMRMDGGELTVEEKRLMDLVVVFDEKLGADEDKKSGVVRYQVNPTANWGPMAKGRKEQVGEEVEVEEGGPAVKRAR